MANEKSSMAMTRLMLRFSFSPGSVAAASRVRKSIEAATRQTAVVGRSVLAPTILPVVAQIAAGMKRRVKNQSMHEALAPRKMRRAAGIMEAKSAASRRPTKR